MGSTRHRKKQSILQGKWLWWWGGGFASPVDAECPGEFCKGAAEDGTISALIDGIIVGMWRTGSYTQLDPDAILD